MGERWLALIPSRRLVQLNQENLKMIGDSSCSTPNFLSWVYS